MKLVIGVLIIIIIVLLLIIISYKRQFKSISKDIKNNLKNYTNIKTSTLDKDLEAVVSSINMVYDERQKLEAEKNNSERELRSSIANMSHDLRTPLTSIMGYLQLLKSSNATVEEKNIYMDIVENRTKSLEELISSFYDLSRIEGNEYKFKLQKVNLSEALCENIALFYNDFEKKNIEPIIEIDEGLAEVITDKPAVNRIFSNLINNILKHGNEYVKITLKKNNNIITTEFINDAPDLNEEEVKKLFDRFYTVDKSRNDKNTGLGLFITKTLVERLGYEIKASLINQNLKISITWKSSK